ncbi:MAG TPA: M20/M25/M40 family metallo-hydrolase [Mycobacteriales bacterium]|nr:M20/M25/M40 family metallo-hydrolase [Mycobacteriales bacterium]
MRAHAEALLRGMVEIPSVSGAEREVAAYLAAALPDWGLRSHLDEVGNVIGRRGDPAAPMIVLLGHLDTVPGDIPVRQEGSILHGRGTVDAKGPLATMVCAAAQADLHGAQVVVAGVVGEETDGHGARHLSHCFDPDAAIIGEPNGWAGIGIGYKGRVTFDYAVRRPPSHTASDQEKASEVAVGFWNRLQEHLASYAPGPGYAPGQRAFDRPIATLGEMTGTIERADLAVSCRIPPGFDIPAFERFLAGAADGGVVTVDDRTPAVLVPTGAVTVQALCAGVRAHGGRPKLKIKTGTADLNVVADRWAVPMAVYGPGDSRLDHTDHEHLDLDEYATAIGVLTDALERLAAGLAPRVVPLAVPPPRAA